MHCSKKTKYDLSQCGRVNFARWWQYTDALIDETTRVKESLDHEFITFSKICCHCVGNWYCLQWKSVWTSEGTSSVSQEAWDEHVLYPRDCAAHQSAWMFRSLPPLPSSLIKISIHLLFANPVNWLILSANLWKSSNQPSPLIIKKEICQETYETGDFVSSDQYLVKIPRWLLSDNELEAQHNQFHGGTTFHDPATVLFRAENQVSFKCRETLIAKGWFEQQ